MAVIKNIHDFMEGNGLENSLKIHYMVLTIPNRYRCYHLIKIIMGIHFLQDRS